jgi:hypothetical protein
LQHLFIFYRIGAGSAGPRFEPRDALCADILVLSVILAIFNPDQKSFRAVQHCGPATYGCPPVPILSVISKRALNGGIGP